jgi:zinc-ribbon domain
VLVAVALTAQGAGVALIKCKECGKEHSDDAKACPHCGYTRVKQVGIIGIAFALIVGVFIFHSVRGPSESDAPPKSQAQIAAESKKEAAFQMVVAAMKVIRAANRNPESVKWESITANDDASVICIEYRGQNGFGGMNRENVVIISGAMSQKPTIWNRNC